MTLDLICVVGGEETAVVVVVVCSLAIIAAGTSSIQSPAVAAASYINCTQRNHSVPEKKASSSKRTSTNASPNFHFTTCELDSVLYSKVFSVLFVWVLFLFSPSSSSQIWIVTGYTGIASSCTRELTKVADTAAATFLHVSLHAMLLLAQIYLLLPADRRKGNPTSWLFVVLVSQWKLHMVHESLVAAGLEGSDGVVLFVSVM